MYVFVWSNVAISRDFLQPFAAAIEVLIINFGIEGFKGVWARLGQTAMSAVVQQKEVVNVETEKKAVVRDGEVVEVSKMA
ncbi:hypothetical protein M8C21_001109, partial [Ambrosia artemisiifolia]